MVPRRARTGGPGADAPSAAVLLDANPLADIRNTTKLRGGVANGRYLNRAAPNALPVAPARRHR